MIVIVMLVIILSMIKIFYDLIKVIKKIRRSTPV